MTKQIRLMAPEGAEMFAEMNGDFTPTVEYFNFDELDRAYRWHGDHWSLVKGLYREDLNADPRAHYLKFDSLGRYSTAIITATLLATYCYVLI